MIDVLLDSLLDSLKVLGIAFLIYIIISFVEDKISHILGHKNHFSPIIGSSLGLIPQCGISVMGANLYLAHHISMGTLIALFISCSDEALPILISTLDGVQLLRVLLIVGIKFVVGFSVGFLVDFVLYKKKKEVEEHLHEDECEHHFEELELEGCCHHHLGGKNSDSKWQKHLFHPLFHSLKIFIYCFIINLLFGTMVYLIGEDNIMNFLSHFKYFSPIISSLIGMIPNCASSVLLTETYLASGIGIGSLVAGLSINAGLGLVFLFKRKEHLKENFQILGILLCVSILSGYIISFIAGF